MTDFGMSRDKAWELLTIHLKDPKLIKHSLASEAVMRRLAAHLGEDVELWGITGLIHDIDLDIVQNDMSIHGEKGAQILRDAGADELAVDAILRHNEMLGLPRETKFHHALAAGETITGLVTATTLVYQDKNLASVKPKSVVKRMKEKAFAAGVNRDNIRECELIGVPLAEFAALAVEAMCEIAADLDLDGRLAG